MDFNKIIALFLNRHVDTERLSSSSNFSFELVKQYPYLNWNFLSLSEKEDLPFSLIKELPDKDWNLSRISKRKDLTWDIIFDIQDIISHPFNHFDFRYLSRRSDLTWDIVLEHAYLDWDWEYLSRRQDLTWEIICNDIYRDWDWKYLITKPDFDFNIIRHHELILVVLDLFTIRNIPLDIVYSNLNLNWDFVFLTEERGFDLGVIERSIKSGKFKIDGLFVCNYIPFFIVEKYITKERGSSEISENNFTLTSDIILKYKDILDHQALSKNLVVTLDFIDAHPEFKWSTRNISLNPNLTSEYIVNHMDRKWDPLLIYNGCYGIKNRDLVEYKKREHYKSERNKILYQSDFLPQVLISIIIEYFL